MTEEQRRELDFLQADAIRRMREMNGRSVDAGNGMPPVPDFVNAGGTRGNNRRGEPHHGTVHGDGGGSRGGSDGNGRADHGRTNGGGHPENHNNGNNGGNHSANRSENNGGNNFGGTSHRGSGGGSNVSFGEHRGADGGIGSLIGGKGLDLLKMLNFGNLKIDSDMTVIITLILMLSSEDCDELLLLALMYIML